MAEMWSQNFNSNPLLSAASSAKDSCTGISDSFMQSDNFSEPN
jgi:hypothetical protein